MTVMILLPRRNRAALLVAALLVGPLLVAACDPAGPDALTITTAELPDGFIGVDYEQKLEAVGGDGDYRWELDIGGPHSGLELMADGVLTGVPREWGAQSFRVRATSDTETTTRQLTLLIDNHPLEITTAALPEGVVGVLYRHTLRTNLGGMNTSSRFWWYVTDRALPPGLELYSDWHGTPTYIYGVPTAAGVYEFTLLVRRGMLPPLDSASRTLSLRIVRE